MRVRATEPISTDARLPVLAIASELTTSLAMRLAQEAEGLCRLVFVRDRSWSATATAPELLARLGGIVTVDRLSSPEAADRVASLQPAGLTVFHDRQLADAARLAARLGLAFHRPAVADRLTDKDRQRSALELAGLAVPRHVPLREGAPGAVAEDVARAGVRAPMVLKPRQGTASRYTVRADDLDELGAALSRLPVGDRIGDYLVEEYLEDADPPRSRFASYVSVETVLDGRSLTHVAVTGRLQPAWPFRESGLFVPSDLSPRDQADVCDLAGQAARALGVEVGVLHTEVKLTPDGTRLIEVNGRVGGAVPELVEAAGGGVSLTRASMEVALGRRFAPETLRRPDRIAYKLIHQPPPGARFVRAVRGLARVAELSGVTDVYLNRGPGAEVDWRRGFDEFVFHVYGTVSSTEELAVVDRRIAELVDVDYDMAAAGGGGRAATPAPATAPASRAQCCHTRT